MPTLLTEGCVEEQKQEPKKWPERKLNIAVIGLGMGFGNMEKCIDENIVSLVSSFPIQLNWLS